MSVSAQTEQNSTFGRLFSGGEGLIDGGANRAGRFRCWENTFRAGKFEEPLRKPGFVDKPSPE